MTNIIFQIDKSNLLDIYVLKYKILLIYKI